MAKDLLERSGIKYEERNINDSWTKEQLLELVPDARTVPQIYMYGEYVGDYNALMKYYEDHNMYSGREEF
jgi:glutaredoxin 3